MVDNLFTYLVYCITSPILFNEIDTLFILFKIKSVSFFVLKKINYNRCCFSDLLILYKLRIKNYSLGIKRPPFFIIKLPRDKFIVPGLHTHNILNDISGIGLHNDSNYNKEIPTIKSAWYLWADRLKCHFYISAIYVVFPVFYYNNSYLTWFLIFLYSFAWQFIIFYIFNSPIADILFKNIPRNSNLDWIEGVSSSYEEKNEEKNVNYLLRKINILLFLFKISLPFKFKIDVVEWSSKNSPQKSVLYLSIINFFSIEEYNEGFIRWFFYWCSPIWSSYISLVSISIFLLSQKSPEEIKSILFISSLIFTLHSFLFIINESNELNKISEEYGSNLYITAPPWINNKIKINNKVALKLTETKLKILFSTIQSIMFASLITIIRLYNHG